MTHLTPPKTEAPDPELRIQIEGAWEVLEQARERQAALLKPLASWRWRRHLRQQPELLQRVREQEAPLAEALARAEHRLGTNASERHPLRLLIRQVGNQHVRMETLVRKRLAWLGEREALFFAEELERLEERMREPHPPRLLHEGGPVLLFIRQAQGGVLLLNSVCLWLGVYLVPHYHPAAPFFIVFGLTHLLRVLCMGRFLLTSRRLVHESILGKTRQVPLELIQNDGIHTRSHSFIRRMRLLQIRAEGEEHPLYLRDMEDLELMHVLLELHRRPPLLGRVEGPPTYPLSLFLATRRPAAPNPGDDGERGMLVLRGSQQIAFLPERGLDDILRALFKMSAFWPQETLTLGLLLEQLSLLPETDFDHCVEQAVRASAGGLWPAADVTDGPAPRDYWSYQLTTPEGLVLTVFPKAAHFDALNRHYWRTLRRRWCVAVAGGLNMVGVLVVSLSVVLSLTETPPPPRPTASALRSEILYGQVPFVPFREMPCPTGTTLINDLPMNRQWCGRRSDDGRLVHHGLLVRRDDKGVVAELSDYLDDKLDGTQLLFSNGLLFKEGSWREGQKVGLWSTYSPLIPGYGYHHRTHEEHYANGVLEGPWRDFDPYGEVIQEGTYHKGLKQGVSSRYVNHYKVAELTYVEDKLHGPFTSWYKMQEGGHGLWQVEEKGEYVDGMKTGLWVGYYPDGQKQFEGRYEGGKQQDQWTYWHPGEVIAATGSFVDGLKDGRWRFFFRDGKRDRECSYVKGELQGLSTQWHENGQKIHEGRYEGGRRVGTWKTWQPNGQLGRVESFPEEP